MKLHGKIIITSQLEMLTGLHIGGIEGGYEIGGMENLAVKDPITCQPIIPGSSIKGKLRSLLEWMPLNNGKSSVELELAINMSKSKPERKAGPCSCSKCPVCIIFGTGNNNKSDNTLPSRIIIRDSKLNDQSLKDIKQKLDENIFTEIKAENTLDRLTSDANPRTMERVPAGAIFDVEMIFDVYQASDIGLVRHLFEGMELLENSALGGGGSRGSGKVKFREIAIEWRPQDYYLKGNPSQAIKAKKDSAAGYKEEWNNIAPKVS